MPLDQQASHNNKMVTWDKQEMGFGFASIEIGTDIKQVVFDSDRDSDKDHLCLWKGLRPSACEADVITTTKQEP